MQLVVVNEQASFGLRSGEEGGEITVERKKKKKRGRGQNLWRARSLHQPNWYRKSDFFFPINGFSVLVFPINGFSVLEYLNKTIKPTV